MLISHSSYFLLVALGVASVVAGVLVSSLAHRRVLHLRQTGETFADHQLSSSRIVSAAVCTFLVVVWMLLAIRMTSALSFIALAMFAAGLVYLSLVDLDTHLLPWFDTGVIALSCSALLILDASLSGRWGIVVVMLIGALVSWCCFKILEWLSRGDLGGGDVVLAAALGAVLGWFDASAIVRGFIYAFVIAGLAAVVLIVLRGARGQTRFAFGPFLAAGAVIVMIVHRPVWLAVS